MKYENWVELRTKRKRKKASKIAQVLWRKWENNRKKGEVHKNEPRRQKNEISKTEKHFHKIEMIAAIVKTTPHTIPRMMKTKWKKEKKHTQNTQQLHRMIKTTIGIRVLHVKCDHKTIRSGIE